MTLLELARAQHGAITRKQALAAGHSSSGIARRLERGEWKPVDDGVYLLEGARPSWLQAAMVATLATGGIASHLTAGRLWKLTLPRQTGTQAIDVLVAAARRPRSTREIHVHRTRGDTTAAVKVIRGIPASDLGPTLIQLSEVLDPAQLARALSSALRQRPALHPWLANALAGPLRGQPAALRLRALL